MANSRNCRRVWPKLRRPRKATAARREGPADRATRATPQRNEHRGKENRQHQVEAEPPRIRDKGTKPIARDRRSNPHDPECQAGADKYAADNSTAGRIRNRNGQPFGGSRLIGSYATVARLLDEMSEIEGLAGVMLTFDDFVIGVEQFGQRIQPLMRSRANLGDKLDRAA